MAMPRKGLKLAAALLLVVGRRLQVGGIPTSYLLDKHGRIAGLEIGPKDWNSNKMRRLLEQLLTEEARGTTS